MSSTSAITFGSLLKRYRRAAGLSQEALAERAGVSARGVQDLERNVRVAPRPETLRLLLAALALNDADRAALIAAAYPETAALAAPLAFQLALSPLPAPPTPLVGREREIAAACALLEPSLGTGVTRLLTLTGPGGVGKTRVALAVAESLAVDFDGQIAWVDLAPLREANLVASAIARAISVPESSDQPVIAQLTSILAGRRVLLVLDNFEQLLPAASIIATLLAAAPGLVVLVTSRARLRLRGEQELPIPPLAVPGAGDASPPEELAAVAAVRLFVARAAEVHPGFALTARNAAAVGKICRRLDGLPLAIELAAARVKFLPPPALLSRLESRLPLLTGGARDLPLRQQTMRDTIAWSYDLLDPPERTLFRRLAVFSGGFTLEAAEEVGGRDAAGGTTPRPPFPPSVLDLVASLVEHSLVRALPGAAEPRFEMLETIREFALEQLLASGEADECRRALAAFALDLAERAEPELTGPTQAEWLQRLETEHANVRAAVDWSLAADGAATAELLVGALWHFWQVRGHVGEGRAWAEAALARGGPAPTRTRARALRAAGLLAEYHGDYDRAVERHEAAAAVWRELGDERNLARTLDHLGNCAHDRGDFARAAALHEQALALARRVGDSRGVASALGNLGIMAIQRDELAVARQRLQEALTLLREMNHAHGVGVALSQLGVIALREGDTDRAVALDQEALAVWRKLGDQDETASALVNLGHVLRLQGDLARAGELFAEARRTFAELGNTRGAASALEGLGTVAAARGDGHAATAHYAAGLRLARDADDMLTIATCLEGMAGSLAGDARGERAARLLGAAFALRETIGAPLGAHLQPGYDQTVAETRAAVGEPGFAAAWELGHRLPLPSVIDEALLLADDVYRRDLLAAAKSQ
jgi:predicted ATPase/transcriptional regulator with XRE-family HTH domain